MIILYWSIPCIKIGRVGMMFNRNILTTVCEVVARCKCCYKDYDYLPMCLIMMWLCKWANSSYMNVNEMTILMQFLLTYDDDDYTRDRPYDLH